MPTSIKLPSARLQDRQLQDDLAAVEDRLHAIASSMHACYGDDSQVAIRADETLCALQRFNWELERVQRQTNAASG